METKKINQNKKIGLTLLLIFVGVYLFSIAWFFESNFLLQGVLVGTANIATTVGIIGPFVWLINRKKEKKEARRSYSTLGLAMLIFLIHTVFIRSGTPLNNFFQLEWNWVGKLPAFMIGLVTIALWPGMTWESIGFKMPKKESWKGTIQFLFNAVIILLVASIVLIVFFDQSAIDLTLDQRSSTRTFETFFYYLVVPALEEELVFRGLLWVLIAKALPRKENITGKNYNWNFIVTTFMFATIHGILFDAQLNFVFDPLMIILTGLGGAYFGIIREKSDSLFPAMIMHNGFHLVTFLVPGLVQMLLT